jgi:hypothetical protein
MEVAREGMHHIRIEIDGLKLQSLLENKVINCNLISLYLDLTEHLAWTV